jgi:SAM-dependent methyltransferase
MVNGKFEEYRVWKGWREDNFSRCTPIDARYFEVELARAGVQLKGAISVLEIGFGNGSFASWARKRGWRYVGIEIDSELVARGQGHGFEVVHADVPLESGAAGRDYDLIVGFDVLEHLSIPDISKLLASLCSLLKSDGRLVARFPSGDSPFSRAVQYGDLTHRSILGSGIIQQLAISTGFRILQIRSPVLPLTGIGLRRTIRRAGVIFGRALVGKLLQLIYFDNQQRVMTPNLLVVMVPGHARSDSGNPPAL